jgi:hypothetical protein
VHNRTGADRFTGIVFETARRGTFGNNLATHVPTRADAPDPPNPLKGPDCNARASACRPNLPRPWAPDRDSYPRGAKRHTSRHWGTLVLAMRWWRCAHPEPTARQGPARCSKRRK